MTRMTREEAIERIKEHTEEYLRINRGVEIKGRFANGTSHDFRCISPAHRDKSPSMFYSYENHRAICRSVDCGAKYDIFDLIGEDYHLDKFNDQLEKAAELYGIQIDNESRRGSGGDKRKMNGQKQDGTGQGKDMYMYTRTDTHTHKEKQETDYTPYFKECNKRITETDYHRGLSLETLNRHWVGYEPEFKTKDYETNDFVTWKALIIPTGEGSYTVRNTDPNATKRNRYRNRGASQVFNFSSIQNATKPVFIVEGEIDAMSIEEAGGTAIGLGSVDNIPLLLRMLEAKKPTQPLIIALDNEADAKKQEDIDAKEKQLTDGLERLGISYYRLRPFAGYHDANEALLSDRTAFAEAISGAENIEKQAEEEERQAYLATNTGAYLQQFINGIAESVNTDAIPSGFKALDNVLDGGFYEGLITVGGISSLGKTSLILQIGDKVAGAGNDCLIFSLEMARAELMAKSISRHTLDIALRDKIGTNTAKTARGVTCGKRYINYSQTEKDLIKAAITEYGKYAGNLYIQQGVGDIGTEEIRETVEKHIRFTGRRPLVIVDYLQVIAPYNERYSDKQNTDKAILELKRISRDCKVPLIAISSLNRMSYKEAITLEAFKESGGIEYGSDIVIGLQLKGAGKNDFNPTVEKKKNPRQVELVILKNRQGKVGDKILFDYYSMFNYFDEKGVSD